MNVLQARFAELRRRRRTALAVLAACRLTLAAFVIAVIAGCADYRWNLPPMARAAILVTGLALLGVLGQVLLVRFGAGAADNLTLALRLEKRYPWLNDSFATAVQFLEQPHRSDGTSSAFRNAVIQQSIDQLDRLDLHSLLPAQRPRGALATLLATGMLAAALLVAFPELSRISLRRLSAPFSTVSWPTQTTLTLNAPRRIALGGSFEVTALLHGVVPPHAAVEFDGSSPAWQVTPVVLDYHGDMGSFRLRRDGIEHDFRFRVYANDAVSQWQQVRVVPPPVLIALGGRPSPQVHLHFPRYTGLPDEDLPAGTGAVNAVAGTRVDLCAATDRPIARGQIVYQPSPAEAGTVLHLAPLGCADSLSLLATGAAGQLLLQPIPARLDSAGRLLNVSFTPSLSGAYALQIEDKQGVGSQRSFDAHIFADPAPEVILERPAANAESDSLLPSGHIVLSVRAVDTRYGLRSIGLNCRFQRTNPYQRTVLYDGREHARLLASVLGVLAGGLVRSPSPWPGPRSLRIDRRIPLTEFVQSDDSSPREGDTLRFHAWADDYDDVTLDKPPGRSDEVEIRIVSRATLLSEVDHRQRNLHQAVSDLRRLQQDAITHRSRVEISTGKPMELSGLGHLVQAEESQQRMRERLAGSDGVRRQAHGLLDVLQNNGLTDDDLFSRTSAAVRSLDSVADAEIDRVDLLLRQLRQELARRPLTGASKTAIKFLGDIQERQRKLDDMLADLGQLTQPLSDLSALAAEAQGIYEAQEHLSKDTQNADDPFARGQERASLPSERQAALDKLARAQQQMEQRTSEFVDRLEKEVRRSPGDAPEIKAILEAALAKARDDDPVPAMHRAMEHLKNNRLAEANQEQVRILTAIRELNDAFRQDQESEKDRLRKSVHDVAAQLHNIESRQQALLQRTQHNSVLPNGPERRKSIQETLQQQRSLGQDAERIAHSLSRLQQSEASGELNQAARAMEHGARAMERNGESLSAQQESVDHLQAAQKNLAHQKQPGNEQLARELTEHDSQRIAGLRDRQQALIAEALRLEQQAAQSGWTRPLHFSHHSLVDSQTQLGADTMATSGDEKNFPTFAFVLESASKMMQQAADRLCLPDGEQKPTSLSLAEANASQQRALARLQQLLDCIKSQTDHPPSGATSQQPGGTGSSADAFSARLQLKLLRSLQAEVNERTHTFRSKHAATAALNAADQAELQAVLDEQQAIARLLDELRNTSRKRKQAP